MEVLARVDLGVDEMKEVVSACHGCLVWGGHVNLSPADDILISVERPLCLDTREQMVASIMSKKLAAGSSYLLIDIPVGPTAKVTTAADAMRLRKLFEFVGDHFGISVEVATTDGNQSAEASGLHDAMAVLAGEPDAPLDLRDKSLRLAARLLEYELRAQRWCRVRPCPGTSGKWRSPQADAEDHRRAGTLSLPNRSRNLDR